MYSAIDEVDAWFFKYKTERTLKIYYFVYILYQNIFLTISLAIFLHYGAGRRISQKKADLTEMNSVHPTSLL